MILPQNLRAPRCRMASIVSSAKDLSDEMHSTPKMEGAPMSIARYFSKAILLLLLFSARPVFAQTAPEGIWQGYDGEWRHVSSQLLALAEATPQEKFSWRPAPGVRSTSEVYMHIAIANFGLLEVTGPKVPADLKEGMEKSVTAKAEVINWLKRSLDAVKQAHLAITPK